MITLQKLKWSNAFSYGVDNEIDFAEVPLLQLVGRNGHGKTSIALILEEVLYNKNSKGLKKGEVLNRYVDASSYNISLSFAKDSDQYYIETKRGSTQNVKLLKNGLDISEHTSTATYKLIQEVVGYDHKTFSQIVFQSSANSLEFLTATDTNRKKFLIDLLNLTKYAEIGEVFKATTKSVELNLSKVMGKVSSIESWLLKNAPLLKVARRTLVEVPDSPLDKREALATLKYKLSTLEESNKKIVQNNKYKQILDALVVEPLGTKPIDLKDTLTKRKTEENKTIADSTSFINKIKHLSSKCTTCYQDIDTGLISSLETNHSNIIGECNKVLEIVKLQLEENSKAVAEWKNKANVLAQYEQYHSLYDPTMDTELTLKDTLESSIAELASEIKAVEKLISDATATNNEVTAHNTKLDLIKEQQDSFVEDLEKALGEQQILSDRLSTLQVLTKTFSTSGLLAYKIECSIKELEDLTNEYLLNLSEGRFQISFKIAGSDKLNVVINDNGNDIDILALSGGERARVNVATLLGIRKLLQSTSKTRINLLFLDETIENLDDYGRDKLVEVLLEEEHLNTVLVSHGFQHPLIEKLHIIKTNNISRIENG